MFLLYAILWVLEVMLSLLRKAEGGERTVGLESPTSQRQLSKAPRPRTGLRTQQHCYFLLPADHEALGQAHINVLNYESCI